jgi:hypothetical protein
VRPSPVRQVCASTKQPPPREPPGQDECFNEPSHGPIVAREAELAAATFHGLLLLVLAASLVLRHRGKSRMSDDGPPAPFLARKGRARQGRQDDLISDDLISDDLK